MPPGRIQITNAVRARAMLELRRIERARRMESYRDDPVRYVREELGDDPTPDQERMMRSVVENRRTIIKASHAVGKTRVAGWLANYWYDCWDQHIVYITAPTWPQALGLTFKEVKTIRRRCNLPGIIQDTGFVKDDDKVRGAGHYIRALNAETAEGFHGEHTAPILVIIEEGIGVPSYIWEATEGLLTHPGCRVFSVGNPTNEATKFGEACSDPLWNTLTVSVFDHPNIALELEAKPPLVPNAVRLLWLREMLAKNCERIGELAGDAFEFWSTEAIDAALDGLPVSGNPEARKVFYAPNAEFQGRALGIFPTQADEQVIPKAWLEMIPRLEPEGDPAVGCDVAHKGSDRTSVAGVVGPCVVELRECRQLSLPAVAGVCIDAARSLARKTGRDEHAVPIKIDVTGGLGDGPADFLEEQGYTVVRVRFSEKPKKHKEFPNVRSEVWWELREKARTREFDLSHLPAEVRKSLVRELTTPKLDWDSRGRRIVQEKKKIKKELGLSPDLAEAVAIAYAPDSRRRAPEFARRVPARNLI